MKLDVTKIRPVFSPSDPKVLDPPRNPKIVEPYEKEMSRAFADISNITISKLTQKMVEFKK